MLQETSDAAPAEVPGTAGAGRRRGAQERAMTIFDEIDPAMVESELHEIRVRS